MAENRDGLEQRIIDHQVRLSGVREAAEAYYASREDRRERRTVFAEKRWERGQVISMLAGAASERELEHLGLSDALIREAGLGDSLAHAWTRFRPALPRLIP